MPPKRQQSANGGGGSAARAAAALPGGRLVRNESLRITDEERLATSKSLYGDHKARVSANTHNIHDRLRLRVYTKAIEAAAKGKTVLHLGCGMGLLSMIAARAGATRVFAVDTSTIVQPAAVVAKANGLDNLTFIQGSLNEGTAKLPADAPPKFDVILCEWMSSLLTNDTAIVKELLYCRDTLLAKDGIVCPNQASLGVLSITDYDYKCETVDYWDNVYGFNMAPMKQLVMKEPTSCPIPKHLVKTNVCNAIELSLDQLKAAAPGTDAKDFSNLIVEGDFSLTANAKTTLHFLTFYVGGFSRQASCPNANFDLASAPGAGNPWTEVSAALPEALPVFPGDVIEGHVKIVPRGNDTEMTLDLSFKNDLITHKSTTLHHFQY